MADISKIKVGSTTYNIVDSNAVHKTGDESIGGIKTFTDEIAVQELTLNNTSGNEYTYLNLLNNGTSQAKIFYYDAGVPTDVTFDYRGLHIQSTIDDKTTALELADSTIFVTAEYFAPNPWLGMLEVVQPEQGLHRPDLGSPAIVDGENVYKQSFRNGYIDNIFVDTAEINGDITVNMQPYTENTNPDGSAIVRNNIIFNANGEEYAKININNNKVDFAGLNITSKDSIILGSSGIMLMSDNSTGSGQTLAGIMDGSAIINANTANGTTRSQLNIGTEGFVIGRNNENGDPLTQFGFDDNQVLLATVLPIDLSNDKTITLQHRINDSYTVNSETIDFNSKIEIGNGTLQLGTFNRIGTENDNKISAAYFGDSSLSLIVSDGINYTDTCALFRPKEIDFSTGGEDSNSGKITLTSPTIDIAGNTIITGTVTVQKNTNNKSILQYNSTDECLEFIFA